jgi:putative ABC transport system permease protein
MQDAIVVLFAATGFVLLIGCANLTNLALARSLSREREMAVRAALGASRWRLVRQFLIENVVISLCGGIGGIGVGYYAMKWIQSLIGSGALPPAVDVRMDTSVLLFTAVVAIATGLLMGTTPAVETTSPDLVSALKEGGHGTTPPNPLRRMRAGLVIAEVAMAFVLLTTSGLLMRSFLNLLRIDPGFDATNVLAADLPINQAQHPDPVELNVYLSSIRAAVEAVPGVRATALTSVLPLQGWGFGMPYAIADRPMAAPIDRRRAFLKIVSPSYFDVLAIKLRAGRVLNDKDSAGGARVAVINQTLAAREFAGGTGIGHRIITQELVPGRAELGKEIGWEIVGVVAPEDINGLGDETSAGVYVSNQQSPTYGVNLVVKADTAPLPLQRAIRSAIDRVSRKQALSDVRTLEQIVQQSMRGTRVMSTLLTVFASIALLLAAGGIYGVISYTAAQRRHEMGIRAALGASGGSLRALVFRDGMRLTLIGLAIGVAGTFASVRVTTSMLYSVDAYDPITLIAVAVVLSGVAALACVAPVWRITKVDPMDVLRFG